MVRKKKKKGDAVKLAAGELEQQLIYLFKTNPQGRYNAQQVAKQLRISNSRDSINHALGKLLQQGLVATTRSGKYKSKKEAVKKFVKQEAKSKKEKGDLAEGIVDATRTGSAYIICKDPNIEKDIFVRAGRLGTALNGDTVQVRWRLSRRGKPEGEVVKVIKRQTEQFIGTLVLSRQFCFVAADNPNMPLDIKVDGRHLMGAENGDKVVVAITQWPEGKNKSPKGEIKVVLGQAGGSNIEMQSILIKNGFNIAFPDEVLLENEAIPTEISAEEIAKRRDFRKVLTFTIDPDTAKDFDDALSIQMLENGNYEVGVHIADVTHYVRPGTALDKEAAKRTTSVYLVDRVCPMLPEKLSNGVCSLRPKEDKLTFSAVFELSPKGDLVSEWFGKTIIHSDRRFAYEEAQEVLDTGEGDYPEELRTLNRFAHYLRKERFKNGSINFEAPEVKFKLDEDGTPLEVYVKERKDANMLIEDFMLLANRRVGAAIYDLPQTGGPNIPFVYRIHDLPDMEKVGDFIRFAAEYGYIVKANSPQQVASSFSNMLTKASGKSEHSVLQQLAIRTMAKAAYSPSNIGHYGLGFETYSHFTSPIRRYADVLAHRILQEHLTGSNKFVPKHKLEEQCEYISNRERKAMEAERESIKYKQVEFLEKHVGEAFEGTITGMSDFGVYVALKANFCEGMVRYENMYDKFSMLDTGLHIQSASKVYKMGDSVWVRIINTNLEKRQIDMELLDEEVMDAKPPNPQEPLPKDKPKKSENASSQPQISTDELLLDAMVLFGKSEIKKTAKKADEYWSCALSKTDLHRNSTLVLDFNQRAIKGEKYKAQKTIPSTIFTETALGKPKKIQDFFKTHLPKQDLETVTYMSFCPFRSEREEQILKEDEQLCKPLFQKALNYLKPTQIISFSGRLRDCLMRLDLLTQVRKEIIESGKRKFTVYSAKLKAGNKNVNIHFLPSPSARIPNEVREKAWLWAFGE